MENYPCTIEPYLAVDNTWGTQAYRPTVTAPRRMVRPMCSSFQGGVVCDHAQSNTVLFEPLALSQVSLASLLK